MASSSSTCRRRRRTRWSPPPRRNGLDLIRLIAPTTDEARLPRVLAATSGFVYYVSIAGITGTRSASSASLEAAIPRIRRHTDLPICIGFGIRTPQQAAEAARLADGAVVGTALVDTLAASLDEDGRARPETVRAGAGPGPRAGRGDPGGVTPAAVPPCMMPTCILGAAAPTPAPWS